MAIDMNHDVLELIKLMQSRGIKTKGSDICCCSFCMLEEGLRWFHRMQEDFSVSPSAEQYACLTGLLVHAGQLDEAVNFIENMTFKAVALSWTEIVRGCKAPGSEALLQKLAI
jgi:pentatricopeptide repeat protein